MRGFPTVYDGMVEIAKAAEFVKQRQHRFGALKLYAVTSPPLHKFGKHWSKSDETSFRYGP